MSPRRFHLVQGEAAERLRVGQSVSRIAAELHVSPILVRRLRDELGIAALAGGSSWPDERERFATCALPVDGGHRVWGGYFNSGVPSLRVKGRRMTVYRIAFRMQYGREPVGRVQPYCDLSLCVEPSHVADKPMRDTLNGILGQAS